MAYIPAVACIGRLRLARLIGNRETVTEIEQIAADYIDGRQPTLPEKSTGSDIAGHILWGELYGQHALPRYVELVQAAANRAFDASGQPWPPCRLTMR